MSERLAFQLFECAVVLFETFIVYQFIETFFAKRMKGRLVFLGYTVFCVGSAVVSIGFPELPVLSIYTILGVFVLISLLYKSTIASRFCISLT